MELAIRKWKKYLNKLNEDRCRLKDENEGFEMDDQTQLAPTQIQDFILTLREQGIEVFKTRERVDQLKPSQSNLDWGKVRRLMKLGFEKLSHSVPIFTSQDHVIADGHHRWYALKMIDKNADMPIWEAQMDIGPLLHSMKRFLATYNKQSETDTNFADTSPQETPTI